ncbi:MAG: hypothetical protein J0I18_07200 [Actinobacteria bacterium]|nr:hypothetical protein [Actinomycetota bacterium]
MTNRQTHRRGQRRAPRGREQRIRVFAHPHEPADTSLLMDALLLHAAEQRAAAEGSPVPHLAKVHKLRDLHTPSAEGNHE